MAIKCPKCHSDNTDTSRFCSNCATPLPSSKESPVTKTLETPREEFTRGTTFAERYEFMEELGTGGMGKVFKVFDKKIKEEVALKILKPEIAFDEKTIGRFTSELKLARKIRHENVCQMYDINEEEGTHYITMEYVPGEDLKSFIRRVGQLPVGKTISIANQVCEGLSEAHKLEVVHRDLKPQNIMIDKEGNARIMDFGIARSLKTKGITAAGVMIGTPEYMSPEQAEVKDVDQRSDIYSLGVILYELVTGRVPFEGETPLGIAMKHKSEMPKDPRELNAQLPEDLSQVILRCMEKNKEKRYQEAEELLFELSKIGEGKVKEEKIGEIKLEKSIVVLPFEDISPGKDNEYFSDGLTEEIISDLSKLHELRVISRTSAMRLKGTDKDIKSIGKDLDVQYVLEGSVRKAGNNLRITAQLINATNDAHLWSEKYKGKLEDVFDIQEKVSRSIVDALELKLSPEEDCRIAKRPIKDLVAYECYLRAKQKMVCWTEDAIDNAIVLLERALQIEGPNELLFATLGFAYTRYWGALPFRQDESELEKADTYADKVFKLNPDSPDGHVLKGILLFFQGKPHKAVTHIKKTYHMDPKNSNALFYLVWLNGVTGHMDAARFYFEKLTAVDPWSGVNPGWIEYYSGNFNEAVDGYRKEYEMDPESPYTRWAYACVLAWAHRTKEACEILEKMVRETPDSIFGQFASLLMNALRGRTDEALRMINPELISAAKLHWQLPWMLASIYSMLGKTDESLDWLEHAISRGFINYPFLSKEEPFLENIRGEPRFKKLMERVKHEWENFEV